MTPRAEALPNANSPKGQFVDHQRQDPRAVRSVRRWSAKGNQGIVVSDLHRADHGKNEQQAL